MAPMNPVGTSQHDKRRQQVEYRLTDGRGVRRRGLVAQNRRVEPSGGHEQQRYRQRRKRDAGLEQSVHQHRAGHAVRESPRGRRARGQPAHVGRKHRRHRQLAGAEYQGELPQPCRLVEQRGQAGKKEAGDHAGEASARKAAAAVRACLPQSGDSLVCARAVSFGTRMRLTCFPRFGDWPACAASVS